MMMMMMMMLSLVADADDGLWRTTGPQSYRG